MRPAGDQRSSNRAAFNLFIESVQEYAIFMLDPEGRVATWNQGAERIYGYTEAEATGRHFSLFYDERDRGRHHPREELEIASERGRYEEEGWRIRKDGTRFWASVVITAVRAPDGRCLGFGKVTRDLTERKRQEEREREIRHEQAARAEAQAANRAKSQFLAAMSHELRTPLNAIMGYVDLMVMGVHGPLTRKQNRSLDRIRKSSEYLLRLINDVLNLTRIEAGQVDYDIQDVPVQGIFSAVEPLMATQLEEKGIAFVVEPCAPDVRVRADPTKVQQIVLNLLTNAYKFTPSGGRITVSCDADEAQARIHVRDTGRGIPRERLATIFEPFVQLDRHLDESSQQGVGLGLAISRDIARAMDGDLTAESEEGRGSTFTLRLPRAEVGAEAPPGRTRAARTGEA